MHDEHSPKRRLERLAVALPALFAWLALSPTAPASGGGDASATSPAPREPGRPGPGASSPATDKDPYAPARRAMVATIEHYSGRGPERISRRVLDAMGRVPRHEFVPARLRSSAYHDAPLPIGEGQTISQPYIVALMTELAAVTPGEKVLEVGTGSGYQAAVLAELGARVFTIEIVESLGRSAAATLGRLGLDGIETRIGDGYAGWPGQAPFDAIVVTAAPEKIPPPLLEQLAPGGRLVVPVGPTGRTQQLTVVDRATDGTLSRRAALPVVFVPFTRD